MRKETRQYIQYLRKSTRFLNKNFEGLNDVCKEELRSFDKFIQTELSLLSRGTLLDNEEVLQQLSILEQVVEGLPEVTETWSNPFSAFNEIVQNQIRAEIIELKEFYLDLTRKLLTNSTFLEGLYIEKNNINKERYVEQGIFFLFNETELKELVKNYKTLDIEQGKRIDENLTDFYNKQIVDGNFTVIMNENDIKEYMAIMVKVNGVGFPEESKANVLLRLNRSELLKLKKQYILDRKTYIEKITEHIETVLDEVNQEKEKLTVESIPTIVTYLGEDVKYCSNFEKGITQQKILKFIEEYPNEIILNLERDLFLQDYSNLTLYFKLLEEILLDLKVRTSITREDIYSAIGSLNVPYLERTISILTHLAETENLVQKKDSLINNEQYIESLKDLYIDLREQIIEHIQINLEEEKLKLSNSYQVAISKYGHYPSDRTKLNRIIKQIDLLADELSELGVTVVYTHHIESLQKLELTVTFNGELLCFDINPNFIVDTLNMACLFQRDVSFKDFQNESLLNGNDNSELYIDLVIRLVGILQSV